MSDPVEEEIVENRRRIENIQGQQDVLPQGDSEALNYQNNKIRGVTDITVTRVEGDGTETIMVDKTNLLGTLELRRILIDILGNNNTQQPSSHKLGTGSQSTSRRQTQTINELSNIFKSNTVNYDDANNIISIVSETENLSQQQFEDISELALLSDSGNFLQYLEIDVTYE